MVLQWIYPRGGGGFARRYLRYRQDMFQKGRESDAFPITPLTLFDFSRHDDYMDARRVQEKNADGWRVSDDSVIGGFSKASASILQTKDEYRRHLAGETASDPSSLEKETRDTMGEEEVKDDFTPFLRWEGNLDTAVGLQSDAQRSGFAFLKSPEYPFEGAGLQGLYNSLEITCRADDRLYTVNLQVSSYIPDDMYQGHIQSAPADHEPGEKDDHLRFHKLILPFKAFRLTAFGRAREHERELDDKINIKSIGVTLMDNTDGDFVFDLACIRAVNVFKGEVFEGPPADSKPVTETATSS